MNSLHWGISLHCRSSLCNVHSKPYSTNWLWVFHSAPVYRTVRVSLSELHGDERLV